MDSLHRFLCVLPLLALLALAACTSSKRTERSEAINATGQASLENWTSLGKMTRIMVIKIDGELLQTKGTKGVFPLSPGRHEAKVICTFSRITLADLIVDAGDASLTFEAKAGTRYRAMAKKVDASSVELWIEDVGTGLPVTEKVPSPLNANPQNVPLFIPIPVSR